jgi:hypothetical protein
MATGSDVDDNFPLVCRPRFASAFTIGMMLFLARER